MKKIKLCLVALIFILSVNVFATDVCSKSYDGNGNMRLRAGLEIDGSVSWSNPAAWNFINENGYNEYYPGADYSGEDPAPWDFAENGTTWDSAGRWFVTMYHGPASNDHYVGTKGVSLNKSMNAAQGHDLTLMFTNSKWAVDGTLTGDYDDFWYSGEGYGETTGYVRPAGKFCTFKVRVTDDAKGSNERYYWIGDTGTGSFTYTKEWVSDNFVNIPEKGRFGEYGEAIWNIPAENLDVYVNVSTIYDQARFGIQIVNNGTTNKYVSLAMCGTPSTCDNPSGAWGHKPYATWDTMLKIDESSKTLLGWNNINAYNSYELDPSFFYLRGIGTIKKALIVSKKAIPSTLEMFSYRFDLTDVPNGIDKNRINDSTLNEENYDTTYGLPPKSSYINEDIQSLPASMGWGVADRTTTNTCAFFTDAQATFDNDGDAVKPDYLIIDKSSIMLDIPNRGQDADKCYPFGFFEVAMADGNFPTTNLWPKAEPGVLNPYEDKIEASQLWPYVDQFTDPLSYMAIWGQQAIAPGKTRDIVTYYGLGGKSFINGKLDGSTFTRQNHSLLVESPTDLSYQVVVDEYGHDTLKPSKFVVKPIVVNQAYVKNVFDFTIKKVKITFGEGLEMDDDTYDGDGNYFVVSDDPNDPENTYYVEKNVHLGQLGVYNDITINVDATGEYSGDLYYTVTIVGQDENETTEWTQTVQRSILVPTTKTGFFYSGPGNLLGNPFKNVDTTGQGGTNPYTITDVYGQDAYGYIWNAETQKYETFSDLDTLRNIPQGYWVIKSADEDKYNLFQYEFPKFTKPNDVNYGDVDPDTRYYMSELTIALSKGWNIVSNPYIYPMQWVNVYVKNKITGELMNMQDAIEAGWLSKTLYSYEPKKSADGSMEPELSKYVGYSTVATQLFPNKGYWIYAYKPVQLYFSNMMYPDAKIYDDDYYTDPDKYFKFGNPTDENYK